MILIKWLIDHNVWIALGASCFYLFTCKLFQIHFTIEILTFVFSLTLLTYNGQSLLKNYLSGKKRNKQKNNTSFLGFILAILSLLFLFISSSFNYHKFLTLSPFAFLCFLYAFEFKWKNFHFRSLRNRAYIKVYLIAIIWSALCAYFPFYYNDLRIGLYEFYWIVACFVFILGITIPFDIRDLKFDNPEIRTIPQVFGIQKSKLMAFIYLILSLLLFTYLNFKLDFKWTNVFLFTFIIFLNLILIKNSSVKKHAFYYSGLIDGSLILFGIASLL